MQSDRWCTFNQCITLVRPQHSFVTICFTHVMHTCTLGCVGATAVLWCSEGIHELCGALKCSRAMVQCFIGRNAMMRSSYRGTSCKDMVGTGLSHVYLPKNYKCITCMYNWLHGCSVLWRMIILWVILYVKLRWI